MSTKAIEEALRTLERIGMEPGDVDAARAELEKIRKAASDWAASDCGELPEESADVIERIAAEALAVSTS